MSTEYTNKILRKLLSSYIRWSPLWIGCMLVAGALGFVYVTYFKKDAWMATVALSIRDEANTGITKLGRFETTAQLKAAQETVLEFSKNPEVARAVLTTVGPPATSQTPADQWPSKKDVAGFLKNAVSIHAPKGAEFGATEVIYLDVEDGDASRAIQISNVMIEKLQDSLNTARAQRASGIIAEMVNARELARKQLSSATKRLNELELKVGADLADLRGLTDTTSGGATTRTQLDQIKSEYRLATANHQQLERDLNLLLQATQNVDSLIYAPGAILNAQPGLKKLRESLVDSQVNVSTLEGRFTSNHPNVTAARDSYSRLKDRLFQELSGSCESLKMEIRSSEERIERLITFQKQLEDRLEQLANVRAEYANSSAEVKTRTAILDDAEKKLADAEASHASAAQTSLISKLSEPAVGDKPVGPGNKLIIASCAGMGLMIGLGVVLLLTPIESGQGFGRRWSDFQGLGDRRGAAANHGQFTAPTPIGGFVDRRGTGMPYQAAASPMAHNNTSNNNNAAAQPVIQNPAATQTPDGRPAASVSSASRSGESQSNQVRNTLPETIAEERRQRVRVAPAASLRPMEFAEK